MFYALELAWPKRSSVRTVYAVPLTARTSAFALVLDAHELRVRVNMNSRYSDLKPDPVCAFDSAWELVAPEYGYIVR